MSSGSERSEPARATRRQAFGTRWREPVNTFKLLTAMVFGAALVILVRPYSQDTSSGQRTVTAMETKALMQQELAVLQDMQRVQLQILEAQLGQVSQLNGISHNQLDQMGQSQAFRETITHLPAGAPMAVPGAAAGLAASATPPAEPEPTP